MTVDRWQRQGRRSRLAWILGVSVAIVGAGAGAYGFYKHQKQRNTLKLLQEAEQHASVADWEKAAASYRQYLWRNPSDLRALSAYGDVLYARLGESPEVTGNAFGVLRKIIDAEPGNVGAINKLARICLSVGRFSQAEDLSSRWVELAPQSTDAAVALARALNGLSKYDEAADALRQALLRMPAEARLFPPLIRLLAVELDDPDEALAWAQKGLRQAADSAQVQMAAFGLYQQRREPDAAEHHLHRALELAPASVDVLVPAAAFFTSRGELDRAAELLDRAQDQSPANRMLLITRAAWAVKKNMSGELAAAAAELMSNARDGDLQMLAQAADLLLRARRKDAADRCIKKLESTMDLGLKTRVADALGGWMDALKGMQALISDRPYTAIAHLENADRRLPSNPRIKTMLAHALAEIDALDSAAGMYRRVISLPGDTSDARLALAWIELARGRTTAAREIIGAMSGASSLFTTHPSGMDGAPPPWHQIQAYQSEVIRITCDLLETRQDKRESTELNSLRTPLAVLSDSAPSDAPTVKLVANCLLLTGQRERAVDLLRRGVRSSNEGAELGAELGRILLGSHPLVVALQGKEVDAANVLADELVERFPHSVAGHELHVRVLAAAQRLPEAQEYVEESATSDDVKGKLSEALAELYVHVNQKEHAIRALRDAVSLLPDDMAVRQKLARLTPRLDEGLGLVEAMRTIEGDSGLYWKYERAGLLLRKDLSETGTRDATEFLEVCLVERPYWVSAQLLLGDAHRRAGRLEEAADSYRAAIAQRAELATDVVALKLVRTLQELDRFAEADAVLDTLAKAHPNAPEILRLVTKQLYRKRDMQSAAATAERLLQIEPDDASWGALTADLNRRAGNLVRAEEIARAALRASPGAASVLWSLAQALIAQKRINEAEATLRDSVEHHDDPQHRLLLARLLAQTGKRGQAETILARTTEPTSVDARVLAAAADIARLLGNHGTQLVLLRRAIEQQGEDPGRSLALAEAFMMGGSDQQRDEATAIVQRRLADDPDDPRALILQGQLAASADSPDLAQAEVSLTRSLSIEPRSAKAHRLLGAVQLRLGRPGAAHDTVSAGLAVAPRDPDLLLTAAQIHTSLGDHAQAVIVLKQLLDFRPRTSKALKLFAAASINSGQVDRAVRFLDTHAPQETRSPTEVAIAAKLQEAKENFDLAETLFGRAAAMDQDSSELHRDLLHFLARRNRFDDIHTLASDRRERTPHDIESLALAAQILGTRSDDSRLREVGLGWLDSIARDYPGHAADATYRSALCYYATGEMGRAESKFLKSLRLAPDSENVVNDLAWLYSEHMERPDLAVALIERFLSGGGVADAHMLDTHGVALLRLDRFDDAKSKLAASLRVAGRTPTRTAAGYHLGQIFLQTGQTQEAMAYIREALYLDGLRGGLSQTEREEARRLMESEASPTPPAPANQPG